MAQDPLKYKQRFLWRVAKAILIPQLLLSLFLWYFSAQFHPTFLSKLALRILVVPLFIYARQTVDDFRIAADAKRMGATLIPVVKGKWPGNVDVLFRMRKGFREDYIMQAFDDLFEEYNSTTINLKILGFNQIITKDEGVVKHILTGDFTAFGKGLQTQERMETFMGDGIFNRDGAQWKMHRSIARPYFSKDRISDFEIFEKHTQSLISLILSRPSEPIDVQDLFARFTLDSATEFLFGACTSSLSAPLPVAGIAKMGPKGSVTEDAFGSFARSFEEIQVVISLRNRAGRNWPMMELFGDDPTMKHARVIRGWIEPIVENALKKKTTADSEKGEVNTFLEHLMNESDDKISIRNQIINMLVAGRDTTACLLTFVIYFLAVHPDVCTRLRAEILSVFGKDQMPTYEGVKELKYLRAVINETLRLFPPVPLNSRNPLSPSSYLLPSTRDTPGQRLYLPANSDLVYSTLHIQRRPDLWGADADKFDPERWVDGRSKETIVKNPFSFVPFHAGPRICLGQNFAYNESSFILIRLLQKFKSFTLAPEAQPAGSLPPAEWASSGHKGRKGIEKIWPNNSVTIYVKGGMWVRFEKDE